MPRGDGTGPGGIGPMTGRAAGYARGGGRGWRNMYRATGMPGWMRYQGYGQAAPYANPPAGYGPEASREAELQALRNQIRYMEQSMSAARERLEELEEEDEGEQR